MLMHCYNASTKPATSCKPFLHSYPNYAMPSYNLLVPCNASLNQQPASTPCKSFPHPHPMHTIPPSSQLVPNIIKPPPPVPPPNQASLPNLRSKNLNTPITLAASISNAVLPSNPFGTVDSCGNQVPSSPLARSNAGCLDSVVKASAHESVGPVIAVL